MARFREYIKTMTDAETGDLALPLVAMNPMGKDHIPALIDEYIALGAERTGCTTPALDPDDLEYTRAVIAPHLDARDRATVIACLFGDPAAAALGYAPQGLSPRAGLALALHDARA